MTRVRRLALAAAVVLLAAVTTAAGWVVAQARYLEDYCTTRTPFPDSATGGRPAYLDGPVTIRCEYDGAPDRSVTDPFLLLGALVLAGLVVAVATVALRWALGASDDQNSDGQPAPHG